MVGSDFFAALKMTKRSAEIDYDKIIRCNVSRTAPFKIIKIETEI